MTVLDVTLVNVALPVMAEKFRVSDSSAVWIITIYQLTITSPIAARFVEKHNPGIIFAILPQGISVNACLYAALGTSLVAGILSATRAGGLQYRKL